MNPKSEIQDSKYAGNPLSDNDLSASLEDYLEAIYHFTQQKSFAQANQVAQALGVGKSSVTWALSQLLQKGLINHAPYEAITLTDTGTELAQKVVRKHEAIKKFLTEVLAVPEEMAQENACRMEHVIERDILERMGQFMDFLLTCPRAGRDWLASFQHFCREGRQPAACPECLKKVTTREN